MTGNKLRGMGIAAALFSAMWTAAPAAGRGLPTLLSTVRCGHPCNHLLGVYKVRPRVVVLIEAYGGELELHWSSWTSTQATGSGTGYFTGAGASSHYPVTVHAIDPIRGRFTLLNLTRSFPQEANHEKLFIENSGFGPTWTPESPGGD